MIKLTRTFIFILCFGNVGFSQLDSYESYVDSFLIEPPVSGFMWFDTTISFTPGLPFAIYQTQSSDVDNNMVLEKSWVDPQLGFAHYKYYQTYKGVKVEGAGCTEHFRSNDLVLINAKLAYDLEPNSIPKITPTEALVSALNDFDSTTVFAWQNQDMEDDLIDATGDPNATYFPTPELVYALDNFVHIGHLIPGTRYNLAYKFDVVGDVDEFNYEYVIDATSGEIIRKTSNLRHNGLATVYNSGSTQTIDTRYRSAWWNDDYVLETTDNGRKVHTKYYGAGIFSTAAEVDDDDDVWTGFATWATTSHWYASKSWDYFNDEHLLDGMDGQGGKVRVFAKRTQSDHSNTHYSPATDKLTFTFISTANSHTGNSPGIVGHEFTHGVIKYSANFSNGGEPGALEESYADIFGALIRKFTISSSAFYTVRPWRIGYCGEPDLSQRSLSDPKSKGVHMDSYTPGGLFSSPTCTAANGQPDTYKGDYWLHLDQPYCNDWLDGVHVNNGPQNYCFYLLAEGGSGTNDNQDVYSVQAIGVDEAADIFFYALQNFYQSSSEYTDSREAVRSAAMFYNNMDACSFEVAQTENAWHAVGIGPRTICAEWTGLAENEPQGIVIFPNPASTEVTISLLNNEPSTISIYDVNGKLVFYQNASHQKETIDVSDFSKGLYFVKVKNRFHEFEEKLIVN